MDHYSSQSRPAPARRRTAYACVTCRTRKSRCDGQDPCTTCRTLDVECSYDHEVSSAKGKSDLIYNAIRRLEQSVLNIDTNVLALRQDVRTFQTSAQHPSPAPLTQYSGDRSLAGRTRSFSRPSPPVTEVDGFANATISEHTSTTEAILHWPIFDRYPVLRSGDVVKSGAIFKMENASQRTLQSEISLPFLSEVELARLFSSFSETVNFFYPMLSQDLLEDLKYRYVTTSANHSTKTCLIFLVIALGCAAEIVRGAEPDMNSRQLMRTRHLGTVHFDAAIYRLHTAYATIDTEAAQCLALTALYYAYLQRPIQAWSMLSSTANKCRVMLSYSISNADEAECIRRIFWTCFILESDYLAELPALPRFGIADMESNVPLPGQYVCHIDPSQNELSSVYFLACISMRRFLNRCHHLLFGQKEASKRNPRRLAEIVSELSQQLEDWRQVLPPAIQFDVNTEPMASQHGAFLRQRYLTCLALIHRPYIITALSDHVRGRLIEQSTVDGAWRCLQAGIMHILNLKSFDQTTMVDVWICSLSMAGTMLILLAAQQIPALAECIGGSRFVVGPHLSTLFRAWVDIHGEQKSPSVQQGIEWIKLVDEIIQHG